MKLTIKEKLIIAKEHVDKGVPIHELAKKYNYSASNLKYYFRLYIRYGDKGFQYQMKIYQQTLLEHDIIQSMSRKGNCLDNSPTENFFGRLKEEMYYGKEDTYTSLNHLKKEIEKYIKYYNEKRIVSKLSVPPSVYRQIFYERL